MKTKVMSPMFSKGLNQMKQTFGGFSLMRLALLLWFSVGVAMAAVAPLTIVVKTDNVGTSTTKQFTLPLFSGASYNFTVNWGDSTTSAITTSTSPTHTYALAGTYTIQLTENVIGGFPRIYFNSAGDRLKLTQISQWGGGTWSSMGNAFWGCSNLTISATDAGTALTGNVADFSSAWSNCSGLRSFPLLNTAAGTNFSYAWSNCSGLTSFPLLNTTAGTNFSYAWSYCSGLTSFPLLNTATGTNFSGAWSNCSGLTSFPLLNTVSGTNFSGAWSNCSGLTSFPLLNTVAGTDFSSAWAFCSGLTNFPLLNISAGWNFAGTWVGCRGLTSFPLLDTAAATELQGTWSSCSGLTSFPLINTSAVVVFDSTWSSCTGLTSFPLINTAAGRHFDFAWRGCSGLTSFPLINTAAGSYFRNTWDGCSSLSNFPRLNLGNMSSGADCFSGVTLSVDSYSNLLIDLAALNTITNIVFTGSLGKYNVNAASAHDTLTSTLKWVIIDGGAAPNATPTVATAAAASPNLVNGTTTTLSALGADDGGEAALTYMWATTGTSPATVAFSANGNNAAKSSTATFMAAGSYIIQCTITDAGNLTVASSVTVIVDQTATNVAVTPASVNVVITTTQPYSAIVKDQFGTTLTEQPAITWSPASVTSGSLSAAGSFTANTTVGGPFTLTATSGSASGTATVTVVNAAPMVATAAAASAYPVTVTTTALSVLGADDGGETGLTYTWVTTGTPPATVAFSANGTNATKNTTATFTAAGSYIIQCTITDAGNLSVTSSVTIIVNQTATSVAIAPASANVMITTTQPYSAIVKDQFGTTLTEQPSITWSPASITSGTLSSIGLFIANTTAGGPYTLTATGGGASGSATVTVIYDVPTVSTTAISDLTAISATSGGTVTSDGGSPVIERGICVSLTANPTTADPKTIDDSAALVVFISALSGLTPGTTYHLRAYAINSVGTSYGDDVVFTTPTIPTVTTTATYNLTATTAMSGGTVISDGGSSVTERGICGSLTVNPTTADQKTIDDSAALGVFISALSGLTPGTTYHLRAYATNGVGTSYGADVSFTTPTIPTVTTIAISKLTGISASSGGNVASDGGSSVTARGICVSLTANPTTADPKTNDGTGLGAFTSALSGLTPGTTYHLRAYATNSVGTSYGDDVVFTTPTAPTVTTTVISNLTATTATSGGTVTSDGGSPVTERGVCGSLVANPTTADPRTSDDTGLGAFTSALSGMTPGTTYHLRAYAINSMGTSYGDDVVFTTLTVPTVSTTAISDLTAITATSGGTVTSDGGSLVIERGICVSSTANPTTADSKTIDDSAALSVFISTLSGLTPGTTYHLRAYAINSVGTSYGDDVVFTTPTIPTVTTTATYNLTATTAMSGGTVISDGGSSVTERGICGSLTVNPTTADQKTIDDSAALGVFISALSGLTPGTTYHLRAYATNGVGTSYGADVSFTTPTIPTVTTIAISKLTGISASSGGNVASDGGSSVTARGICVSLTANPTTADPKTNDGTGLGAFTSALSGLTPGTTYHLRAYATNSVGTSYGDDVVFTTPTAPTVTTTVISNLTATTATSGGTVTSDGGSPVTERGVCGSLVANPTTADPRTSDDTGLGAFTSALSGMTPGTTYHLRAYAINSMGTSYGDDVVFTTLTVPTVSTTAISDLTAITATSGGTVTSDGGSLVIERGICVSSTANPTTADSKTIDDSAALSVFISALSGLTPGTTYHLRAYAINSVGTSYGDDVVFTTINSAPIIVNAALANPGTGTGSTVALSVLGADDGGEAALTYTWAITDTPPAAVIFGDNGTNAAKSSTAIFTASGSYILQCTITDAGNLFVTTDSVSVTVVPSIAKISLYPATISLPLNGTASFSATAVDQFDQSLLTQPAFIWASTAGTVTGGSFMANTTPGAVTVSATSGGITGTAQATIQNTPPTIAQAPAAQINDPQALSALLSVLGSDDGGESNLTYTWTTVGAPPAPVTFDSTVNGTNLGKSMSAFFTKIGTYSFQVTIKDTDGVLGGLQIVSSTITANVFAVPSKIVTSPKTAVVALSETELFQTTVSDQFGAAIAAQAVTWSVNGGGTITTSGLFTAGATVSGPYNVVAQLTANPTITDTSLVTIVQAPLFVSQPLNVTVQAGQSATFAVVVSGIPTPTLQWYRGRVAIPGAIGTSIIISQTVPTDNNSLFKCIATNSARIVSSSTALLSVLYAPKIITQPVDQQVVVGQPATFNVIAEGYGQLTYQWSRSSDMGLNWSNWSNISGATQAQYTISTTASVDNYAVFRCTVKDSLSKEVESSTAILKIKSVDDAPLPIVVTGIATLGYSQTGIAPEKVNGKMVCYTTSKTVSVGFNCSAKNAKIVKIKVSLGSRYADIKLKYIGSDYSDSVYFGDSTRPGRVAVGSLIDGTYELKVTVTARNELTETSVDLECPLQILVVSSTPISLTHLLPRRFYPIDDNFKDKGVVDLPFLYRSDGIKSPYYSSLGAYTINATNEAINATMRTYFQKPFYNIDDIGGLIFSVSGGCDIDSTQLLADLNGGGGGTLPSPIVLSVGSNDPDAPTATSSTKYRIRVNGISEELKRLNPNKGLSYFSVSVQIKDKAGNKYLNPYPAIFSYNETERQYSDISGYLSRPGRNSAQWYSDLMGLRMTWNRGDFFSADTNARGGRYESPQIGSLVIGSQAFESYFDWGNTDVKGIDDFGIITNRTIDTYPEGTYNNIHYQRYIDQQFKFNKLKDAGQIYADNVKWIKGSEYGYSYTEADFSGPSSPVMIDIPPKSGRYYIGRKDGVMSFMEHPDYSNLINRREAAPYEWPSAGGRYDNTYRDTIGLFQTNLTHRVNSQIQISPIDVQVEAGNSGRLYVSPGIITLPPTWSRIGAQDAFTKVRIYDKPKNMGLGFVGEIFLKSASDILRADSDFTKLFGDFYGSSTGAYADVTDFGLEGTISLLQPSRDGFNISLSPGFGSLEYRYSQLSYSNYRNTVYQNSVAFWLNSINLSPDNAATGTKKTISVNAGFLTPDFRVTQFRKNGDYVRFLNGGTDVTTTSAQYGIDGSGLTPEQLSQRIVITDQRIIHDHIDTWVKQRLELDLLIGSNVQPGLLDVDVNFGAVHAYATSELDDAVKGSTFNGGASHRMLKAFAVTDLTTKMVFLQDDNTLKEDSSIQVQGDMRPGLSVNIDAVKFSGNNMTVNLGGTIFDRLSEISKAGQEIKKIQVYLNSETLPEWDIPIVYTAGTSLLKRTMQRQFNSSFTIDTQFDRAVCISVVVTNAAGYMAVASAAKSIAVDVIRSDAPPSDVENMAKTPDPQPANIVEEAIAGDVIVGFARTTLIDPTTANSFPIVKPTLSLDGQALSIENKYVAEIEAAVNDNKAKNSYIPLDANGDALPFIFRGPGAADLPFGASVKVDYWFWENISNATIKFDGKIYGKTEFEKEFNVQIYQYTPPADINEGVNAPKRRFVPCTMEEISGALVLMQNPATAELISNFKLSGDVFPIGEVTDNFLRNAPTLPNSDRPLVSLVLDDTKSGLEVGGPNSATDYIIHVNLQARWTLRTRYRSPEEIATDVIEQLNAFIEAKSKNVYYIISASSYMSEHGYSTADFSDAVNGDLLVGLAIAELRKAAAANIRTLGDIVSGAASLFNPGIGFSMVLNDASEGNWTSVALSALPMLKVLPAARNGLKKLTIKNKSGTKLAEIDQELITKLSGLKKPGSDAVDDLFALANRIPEDEFIKLEEGAQKLVGGAICTIGCFSQGTMIHTGNGLVAIERLRPGDKILSYNEVTGSTCSAMVESNDRRFASSSIIIGWSQGPAIGRLRSTAEHPYLRVSEQGQRWVEAGELQIGDQVRTVSGLATITFIEKCNDVTPIYSLVIFSNHTFAVGDAGIIVHNGECAKALIKAIKLKWGNTGYEKFLLECPQYILNKLLSAHGAGAWNEVIGASVRAADKNKHELIPCRLIWNYILPILGKANGITRKELNSRRKKYIQMIYALRVPIDDLHFNAFKVPGGEKGFDAKGRMIGHTGGKLDQFVDREGSMNQFHNLCETAFIKATANDGGFNVVQYKAALMENAEKFFRGKQLTWWRQQTEAMANEAQILWIAP